MKRRGAVQKKRLGHIGRLAVWLVHGEWVRNEIDVDFVLGGNPERYSYVPAGEIWVEDGLSVIDTLATILHECVEYKVMRDGLQYETAHDVAARSEEDFREELVTKGVKRMDLEIVRERLAG